MATTLASLRNYVGKSIGDICSNGYLQPTENHCAHFVSHASGIQLGLICGDMEWKTRKTGTSLRCDEIYNRLVFKGEWEDRPTLDDGLLIFVISAAQVRNGFMQNIKKKHVGIHFSGQVFHYSNTQSQVVFDPSVEMFHNKFKRSYGGKDISLFSGVAP
jgi:hypothetical protein